MPGDSYQPTAEDVEKALSELLSYWTNVGGSEQESVVASVLADLPTDNHNRRTVLVGRTEADRRKSPVEVFVESLDGDFLLVKDVAERLKRSESWVRTMSKDERVNVPSFSAPFGRIRVGLYTEDDVQKLRALLDARVPEANTDV